MPEEEAQLGNQILSALARALGIAQNIAPFVPLPLLSPTVTYLATIVTTIQAVGDNNDIFASLGKDAMALLTILTYWTAKGLQNSADIEDSVKRLHDTLEEISEFAKQQRIRSIVSKLVWSKDDSQKVQKYRKVLADALQEFKIHSHLNINVKLSDMDASINARLSTLMSSFDGKLSGLDTTIYGAFSEIRMQLAQSDLEKRRDKALSILLEKSESGATHDSAARGDVPQCLEGTRKAIIEKIMIWLDDQDDTHAFLWIYGPAGCGKTSIAQSISKLLEGYLAGSFFWSRSASNRPTSNEHFVTTIAHQFCKSIIGFDDYVTSALEHDSAVVIKTLSIQMAELVAEPLNRVFLERVLPPGKRWLLLIDALDECIGNNSQIETIKILSETLANLKFPLRILLCSRDEHAIRTALTLTHTTLATTLMMVDLANEHEVEQDIRQLVKSRFDQITKTHPARINLSQWPIEKDLNAMVKRSAKLFIYADVVMRYIESPDSFPPQSLKEVLELSTVDTENIFRELDAMYAFVLNKIPAKNAQRVRSIFLWLIFGRDDHVFQRNKLLSICDKLFAFDEGEAAILLHGLKSVIKIRSSDPDYNQPLGFFHASFGDLLRNRDRLQCYNVDQFYCDEQQAHSELAERWIALCKQYERLPEDKIQRMFEGIEYHCKFMRPRFESRKEVITDLQNLDLSKYLSLSDDSHTWWLEMHPVLQFVAWFEERTKDNSELAIQSLESFAEGVSMYWLKLSPEAQINMEILLKSPSLYGWVYYLQHPIFALGTNPQVVHMLFNTILTRSHWVEGVDGYDELAIWLLKNWNFEAKDDFQYGCHPFIQGHRQFALLLSSVLARASANEDLQALLKTARRFLLTEKKPFSEDVDFEMPFTDAAEKYLRRTNAYKHSSPILKKTSVQEDDEQESPSAHDSGGELRNESRRENIFGTSLDYLEVPARAPDPDANDELAVRNDSAAFPVFNDRNVAMLSRYAGVHDDTVSSGTLGVHEEVRGAPLEYHPRPLESATQSKAEAADAELFGETAKYSGSGLVQPPRITTKDHIADEEAVEHESADVWPEGQALCEVTAGDNVGATIGFVVQGHADQRVDEVGDVQVDANSLRRPTEQDTQLRDNEAAHEASAKAREAGHTDEDNQVSSFGGTNNSATDTTRREEKSPYLAIPSAEMPKHAAIDSVPLTDNLQSSTLEMHDDGGVSGEGEEDTKMTRTAGGLLTVTPDSVMDRAQPIQSVGRGEPCTGSQETGHSSAALNVRPAVTTSKNERPGEKETEEAVKRRKKGISLFQHVGRFLKGVVCCR